jgi:hypothetical protein
MSILLTREERLRFIAWLEQAAASEAGLADQLSKLPGIPKQLADRKRTLANAQRMVAEDLKRVQEGVL